MRPYVLNGHSRSITFIKYNRDGDLLFSCGKDHTPCVWRGASGERIGTYNGHKGTVWGCDVTPDSTLLLTASADPSVKLWDVRTGRELFTFEQKGAARSVAWAEGEKLIAVCCDPFGADVPAHINIYEFAASREAQSSLPIATITNEADPRLKMTKIAWCIKNSALLVAYENGKMALYDTKTLEKTKEWEAHTATITSMTFNAEKTLLITSSTDQTAKLWDTATWNVIRTYSADTPLNCVSMSPIKEHVIMGGGQEAMKVTTTRLDEGKFQTRFYHMVTGKELGRVKGHFGTMNTLAFNPDGRSFASGGEDGFIRLYPLDEDYEHLGEEEDKDLDDAELGKLLAEGALERLLAEEEAAKRKAAAAEAAALAVYGAK